MTDKKISIVILTYNSQEDIMDCLASVYCYNDIGDALEVIVVDNNSPQCDKMFAMIKDSYGSNVILVKNRENKGYGQGNNVGILAATAPYIMIMNPDVRLTQAIFATAYRVFDKDCNVMMYGIKQMLERRKGYSISWTLISNAYIRYICSAICNKYDIYIVKYMYFAGACFFLRKNAFVKVGLFDENIFMYGEEDDIHRRLLTIPNAKFVYNPNMSYLHMIGNRQLTVDYLKRKFASTLYLYQKNGLSSRLAIKREILSVKIIIFVYCVLRRQVDDKRRILKNWLCELYKM